VLRFVIRRLLIAIPIVIAASFVVFLLVINAGTPAPVEQLQSRPGHSEAALNALKDDLGLNDAWYVRYGDWASGVIHGDFGKDNNGRDVGPNVYRALKVTLRLVIVAELLAIALGVTVGVVSAVRQYSWFDYTATGFAFLFYAMPVFWFAILLKEFGAIKLNGFLDDTFGITQFMKTIGFETTNFDGNVFQRAGDAVGFTVLPVVTLTVISFAAYSRFQRASMLDTLNADYVRTARAKGIPNRRVVFRHAFRNALIPVTTVVAIDFGALFGGTIITENVFSWPGMGSLFRESVQHVDPNVLLCWLLVTAATVVIFNIIADVLYAFLDPRIRIG
jgi:peptide/nickel transport system permease protein